MNNTIQIDRYLQGEMSAGERAAFEKQLSIDKELREELHVQEQLIKAAMNAGLKHEFARAVKNRIITRRLTVTGIILVIIAAAFLFYALKTGWFSHKNLQENVHGFSKPETFDINTAADTIIETRDGVVFAIPANAFNSDNSSIRVEIKTALTPADIINYGLSTMSNADLLQTAGMFSITGFANGRALTLNKDISVSIPAKEVNPAMQLFDGVEDSTGKISWINPRPIEKKLRTYDISTLDFYPPRYIPTLKALQKNYQNKKYTDSLYYSFSGYPHSAMPQKARKSNEINDYPTDTLLPYDIADSSIFGEAGEIYQIDPAKIKALWDKQFNNTIIATKEFEERLRYMHGLCFDGYIEVYLHNLDKPLYESDQFIADNTEGEIRKKFLEFAARRDGSVMIAAGMQEKLSAYFQQRSKAYREAVEKTWTKYYAELNRLNKIADSKNREEELRNFTREANNFREEFCINLTDAYKQIGIKRNCNDTLIVPPAEKFYNVTISTPGWKNLDVYVFDATENRQSMTYTDPATGKVAKLIYKEVSIKIENEQQFDRVLVYLIPDSLSSFQRMQKKESGFKESLNSLFRYNAVALAYKGGQAYFYRQAGLQPKEYSFSLSPLSNEQVKAALEAYSFNKGKEIITEFEYRLFEQEETLRQLQLIKDRQFREKIAASIYNCSNTTPVTVEAIGDSVSKK